MALAGEDKPPGRKRAWLRASLVFVAAQSLATVAWGAWHLAEVQQQRADVERELARYGNTLSQALNGRFALLEGLRAFVASTHGRPDEDALFDAYAAGVLPQAEGVRALQRVDDGVIARSLPRDTRARLLGYNLRTDPRPFIREDLAAAERSTTIVLSGPVNLLQGGLGVVGRAGVRNAAGELLCVVAVVVELAPLLRDAGLLATPGIKVALLDVRGAVFHGDGAALQEDPVRLDVHLPDRHWELVAVPSGGWGAGPNAVNDGMLAVLGTLLCLLLAMLTHQMVAREEALELALADRMRSLTEAMEVLEDQVMERVRAERRLEQAARMEGLGRLAGGVAHDFNNLLTAILGYVSMALPGLPQNSPERRDLEEAVATVRRASDLTRQLLTFARRQPAQVKRVEPSPLVEGMRSLLERMAGARVVLTLDLDPKACAVMVDPGQLEQVLANMVLNARDAMVGDGRVTIRTRNVEKSPHGLGTGPETQPRPMLLLEVEDTGQGMDETTRAHIFEPFFTTKEDGRGTGLGLATSYAMVRSAGGQVLVESAPGKGSVFQVFLPAAPETAAGSTAGTSSPAAPSPASGGAEVLLVAEDDAKIRELEVRLLQGLGYQVLEAGDGAAALELARAHPGTIHALVSDVAMPKKGGVELATELRALRPGVAVLLVSAHPREDVRPERIPGGAGFLSKPFTLDSLAAALREQLERGSKTV